MNGAWRASDRPLYISLAQHLREQTKPLPAHSKLPSVRALARDHEVNPSTVVAALNLLESEGLVYCREGSGTYLAPRTAFTPPPKEIPRTEIDFTSGTPSPEYFPVDEFRSAFNTVFERDRGQAFAYPDPEGYYPLRLSISDYLASLGMTVDPSLVHITSGAQQAIYLLAQLLLSPGDTALIESPCYPGAAHAFKSLSAKVVEVPLGYNGLKMSQLQKALRLTPRLLYTIPNFQNPTGVTYSPEIRKQLISDARELDFYIVEDDHISELYYTPTRPRPLWLDGPDRVLYVKSFSKLFMPGLRLGFVVVPQSLAGEVSRAKSTLDLGSSGITQRALDLYLRSGRWESHLEFLRGVYGDRARALYNSLKRHLQGEVSFQPLRGGMNCWVGLPPVLHSDDLLPLASQRGIHFTRGSDFSAARGEYKNYLRLSIAATFPEQIESGVGSLAAALRELQRTKKEGP